MVNLNTEKENEDMVNLNTEDESMDDSEKYYVTGIDDSVEKSLNDMCTTGIRCGTFTFSPFEPTSFVTASASSINLDEEEIIKSMLNCHSRSKYEKTEDGLVYFCDNGDLIIKQKLPCGNAIDMLFKAGLPFNSCEEALSTLGTVKDIIEKLEETVYNLSLEQKNQLYSNEN